MFPLGKNDGSAVAVQTMPIWSQYAIVSAGRVALVGVSFQITTFPRLARALRFQTFPSKICVSRDEGAASLSENCITISDILTER